jgi:hypothetical protein
LESIIEKLNANEAKLNTIESKIDKFVAEYKSLLYGWIRDKESAAE